MARPDGSLLQSDERLFSRAKSSEVVLSECGFLARTDLPSCTLASVLMLRPLGNAARNGSRFLNIWAKTAD
jgi:hypothetical protein